MDVRKATSSQIIQPQTDQKSEVTKTKSAALNPIADSFEKENAQSSSSNASSTASTEPEKKAGQITGGILIKQMRAAQLGEGFAKKELSPEQQSRVSNSNPGKESFQKPSYSLQDARSRYEDSKNSGLQAPFAPKKGDAASRVPNVSKDQIIASLVQSSNEQTSNAVKDADRLVVGGSLSSQVDAEVAERHQDSNALGGSTADRLSGLLNPTAAGPQQSGKTGKDQLAYMQETVRHNEDGTSTSVIESADALNGDIIQSTKETNYDSNGKEMSVHITQTRLNQDNSKVTSEHTRVNDDNGNVKSVVDTSTTTKSDGTVIVDNYNLTVNDDGSTTETNTTVTKTPAPKTSETTTPGGGAKSYDPENYTGNIPDELKKTMEYFKQQAISQKPSSGGETAHTDDNAEADPTVGRGVSNLVAQQGNVGLFGNPGSRDAVDGGTTGGQGHLGSQSGGNVDFGQDSDQVGYAGVTHEDDPSDVQFGPAEQPKDQPGAKKSEDSDDSSSSYLDPLRKKRRDI